jgi:hypothetical protein
VAQNCCTLNGEMSVTHTVSCVPTRTIHPMPMMMADGIESMTNANSRVNHDV